MAKEPLILIPARMSSTRLPGKPLADIHGQPMIVHVMHRAREANLGRVVIATDTQAIMDAIQTAGGEAVMTRADHNTGSDRIFEAMQKLDPTGAHPLIINVQGDLPTINPAIIRAAAELLDDSHVDIGTLCAEIMVEDERTNPNVVKVIGTPLNEKRLKALYFSRATAPFGSGPLYHHIGLYAYRREALTRFVSLKQGTLEKRESLEQLRALENAMRIDVAIVKDVPLGVDTPHDLDKARKMLR